MRTDTGGLVILDAGTGIRELGRSLVANGEGAGKGDGIAADIYLTHAHWDHIQGIPFFAPIFQAGNRFKIWGSKMLETSIDRVVRDQMAPTVFPVSFEELKARVEFYAIAEEERRGDGYVVRAFAVQHPGGALGYRFTDASHPDRSFVYISDNELGTDEGYATRDSWRDELVTFVRGAALLVHDATYTTDEYEQHRGWGHSTYDDAVQLALDAGVKRLVLYHHKPERSDDDIDRCVAACRALVARRGGTLQVTAAAEGMTLDV